MAVKCRAGTPVHAEARRFRVPPSGSGAWIAQRAGKISTRNEIQPTYRLKPGLHTGRGRARNQRVRMVFEDRSIMLKMRYSGKGLVCALGCLASASAHAI